MKLKKSDTVLLVPVLLGLFLLPYYLFVIAPALSRQKSQAGVVIRKETELHEMMALQREWKDFQQTRREAENILEQRGQRFTLLTYLERLSRKVGIDSQIQYIRPVSFQEKDGSLQPSGIEMRFNELDIKQLVDFLYSVEQSRNLLTIPKIKMRPTGNTEKRSVELTLQVNTYSLSK